MAPPKGATPRPRKPPRGTPGDAVAAARPPYAAPRPQVEEGRKPDVCGKNDKGRARARWAVTGQKEPEDDDPRERDVDDEQQVERHPRVGKRLEDLGPVGIEKDAGDGRERAGRR